MATTMQVQNRGKMDAALLSFQPSARGVDALYLVAGRPVTPNQSHPAMRLAFEPADVVSRGPGPYAVRYWSNWLNEGVASKVQEVQDE